MSIGIFIIRMCGLEADISVITVQNTTNNQKRTIMGDVGDVAASLKEVLSKIDLDKDGMLNFKVDFSTSTSLRLFLPGPAWAIS